jgi:hypothetical protein
VTGALRKSGQKELAFALDVLLLACRRLLDNEDASPDWPALTTQASHSVGFHNQKNIKLRPRLTAALIFP